MCGWDGCSLISNIHTTNIGVHIILSTLLLSERLEEVSIILVASRTVGNQIHECFKEIQEKYMKLC
ncbi:hypothetical protein [Nostoc linckia]|uniref:hypothetical protein n=1 Tax=Nostoc linckia TaxID=92942 RepID=UPI00117C4773|nr:hypothetical protein [Nostoc linckia]